MDGGDQRFAGIFDPHQPRVRSLRPLQRLLPGLDGAEDFDVGAGNESRAAANQDHGVDACVGDSARNRFFDAFEDARPHGVDGRIVDSENGDAVADVVSNEL